MAYSTNPNLPKARAIALKLLIKDGLSVATVARKCGVYRPGHLALEEEVA